MSSLSDSSPGSSHGYSLQGRVSIAYPSQGSPPSLGGMHTLYIVWIPPPQANEQSFQSFNIFQCPFMLSIGTLLFYAHSSSTLASSVGVSSSNLRTAINLIHSWILPISSPHTTHESSDYSISLKHAPSL